MLAYYSIFGSLILLDSVARSKGTYWFALLTLFAIAGFRFEVGCDWTGYLYNWYLMEGRSLSDAIVLSEPAHWVIIVILQDMGLSYTYRLVVASAIFFIGLHALARRQPNPLAVLVLAFPILIINMTMSGIRQAEAIGIMCLAFNAFTDRKLLRYVLLVGLATLFHESAMVFLALAPLVVLPYSRKSIIIALLLALPGLYLMMQSSAANEAAARYVGAGIDAAGSAFRLAILVLSGAAYILIIRPLWKKQYPGDYKLITISAWLMVGFFSLYFVSSVIGDRFGYFLIPLQLVIFARLPYLRGLRNRRLWTTAPYAMLTTVFVVWTQLSWHFQQCYVPYQFGIHS